jgi:hypothetical protein
LETIQSSTLVHNTCFWLEWHFGTVVVFSLTIVACFLRFSISAMYHCEIMKRNVSERPIIRVHISIFSVI